jgi:hypothetical protein
MLDPLDLTGLEPKVSTPRFRDPDLIKVKPAGLGATAENGALRD